MRTEDSPRMLMYEQLFATQFIASPYRRPVIGRMNDLDAMTPQDARDFYRHWYVPANAAVVVVGDVDVAEVQRLAEATYGKIPAGVVPARKPRLEPAQTGTRRVLLKAPADQAYIALSWKVPNFLNFDDTDDNRDALALTLLAAVLDGYNGARLDRALAQGEGRVADSAGASNTLSGRGPQVFMLDGVPAKGKTPEQLEAALRAQITRIAKESVSEAEMRRVKAQWMASNVYQRDSIFNQARELGSSWIEGMPLDSADRLMERLNSITAAHVQAVAVKYFGDDTLTVATLLPQAGARAFPRKPSASSRHGEATR
jgi:zinc protease